MNRERPATTTASTRELAGWAAAIILVWSCIFSEAYTSPFYWDDLHFIRAYSASELISVFHGPFDPDRIETAGLRPVATLLYAVQGAAFGEHIVLQHVFMVALMAGLLWAAGLLMRAMRMSRPEILVALMLFAASRPFALLAMWMSLSPMIVSYLTMILGALFYLRWVERRERRCLWLAMTFVAVSVFAREEAYTMPAVLPVLWLLSGGRRAEWRGPLAGAAAVGVVVAVHVLFRGLLIPDAPSVHLSLQTLRAGYGAVLHSALMPGGRDAFGDADRLVWHLWHGVLGVLFVAALLVRSGRPRRAVAGLGVVVLLLSAPALAVARPWAVALPSLAVLAAISIILFETRRHLAGSARPLAAMAAAALIVSVVAVGVGAGLRRSWYVAEALHEHSASRALRDGWFVFDVYDRPATIPPARREAGLARFAAAGIRSKDELMQFRDTLSRDPLPARLRREARVPLFLEKYDLLSY